MSFDSSCVLSSARTSPEPPGLERKLGLAEAMGLSLSIMAPTMPMAFNVSLVPAYTRGYRPIVKFPLYGPVGRKGI